MRKITLTDNTDGKQVLIGKGEGEECLQVKTVKQVGSSVIIYGSQIDHIFLSGDFLSLELLDKKRFSFVLKVDEK